MESGLETVSGIGFTAESEEFLPQRSRRTAAEVAEKAFNREVRKASPPRAQRKAHCLRTAIIDVAAVHCRILGFNAEYTRSVRKLTAT